MSGASEQANGQASGPVLQSAFLVILAHSAAADKPGLKVGSRRLDLDQGNSIGESVWDQDTSRFGEGIRLHDYLTFVHK